MAWYFNFCAPTIPNDSTINFHRGFQSAQLAILMILFVLYHTYYKLWGPDPLTQIQEENESNESESKRSHSQSKSSSEQKSPKSSNKSNNFEDKLASITENIKDVNQQNESYVSLKQAGGQKFLKKRNLRQTQTRKYTKKITIKVNVTAQEIESFFPIVFGHHAIAMGVSIMYSPYAEQSIASVLYVLFSFLLAMVNSKRMRKATYGVWIFMAFLNIFIMMSAVLELGQCNWDYINNMCFAQQYTSLY